MDKELKDTLSKVADYNTIEKEKVLKIGNTAFGCTFINLCGNDCSYSF